MLSVMGYSILSTTIILSIKKKKKLSEINKLAHVHTFLNMAELLLSLQS